MYTFMYQKTLLHTLSMLVFKIVESLHCILNFSGNLSPLKGEQCFTSLRN